MIEMLKVMEPQEVLMTQWWLWEARPVSPRCKEIPPAAPETCEPSRRNILPVNSDQGKDIKMVKMVMMTIFDGYIKYQESFSIFYDVS